MNSLFPYINLMVALILLLFGGYVYSLDKEEKLNKYFFKMCFIESVWVFFIFQMRTVCDINDSLKWFRLSLIWPFAIFMLFNFLNELSQNKEKNKIKYTVFFTTIIIFLVDTFINYNEIKLVQSAWGWSYTIPANIFSYIRFIWVSVIFIYGFISVLKVYDNQNEYMQRKKYRIIIIGLFFYAVLLISGSELARNSRNLIPEIYTVAYLFKVAFIWFAMKRYDLFRIKISKDALGIFDSLIDMVIITDNDGKITYTNQKVVDVFKVDLKGDFISQYIRKDKNYLNYETFILMDKKFISVLVSTSELSSNYGFKKGKVYIVRNITEIKKYENALIKANKEYEQINIEMKKMQKHIVENEKMAGIGHLSAGLAHEINNPIGFVKSNIETLSSYVEIYNKMLFGYRNIIKKLEKNEDYSNIFVEDIERFDDIKHIDYIGIDSKELIAETLYGIERVTDIIKSLKEFSSENTELEMVLYDINHGITSALLIAKNKILNRINVVIQLDEIPQVRVYRGMIDQVLLNLIINAIDAINEKYSGTGGLIKISTYIENNFVVCKVEDDGIGIDEGIINNIFNPFFTTKRVGEGTGLGLSIVYDIIVNKHGGDIWADSKQGEWTKFTFKLEYDRSIE